MGKEDHGETYQRTAAIVFSVLIFIMSFLIIRPFIVAILSAAALAYLFYPFYLRIEKKIFKKLPAGKLAALFTCFVIILIVLIPASIITVVVSYEIKDGYKFLLEFLKNRDQWIPVLPPYLSAWSGYFPQFSAIASDIAGQLIGVLQGIIKGIPNVVLNIFITVFATYYFLVHAKDIYSFFSDVIPLPEGRYRQIIARFDDLSRGMILGQIVVGFAQGALAWIGFSFLGVPNAVLWGFLTALISIIPLLGAVIIWFPIFIYLLIIGMIGGEYFRAIALLLYGTFVISLIDNFLKPKVVGDHAKIHPLIILFGILGGIQLFGIAGILIGPLILALFDIVIEIYKEVL